MRSLQGPNDKSKAGFRQSFPLRTSELIELPSRGGGMLTGAWETPKADSLDSSVVFSIPPSLRGCQQSPGLVLIDAKQAQLIS